ncbi:MAG TPA: hypothetical protein VIJ14_09695, partial [Rhabdochlamydiaceae bacterium]
MKKFFIRFLFQLRYRVKIEGVNLTRLPQALYISDLTSQLDPLFLTGWTKGQVLIAIRLLALDWIERLASWAGIVFFSRTALSGKPILARRLQKAVAPLLTDPNSLILFPQTHVGRNLLGTNPLIQDCLQQGREIILVNIEG